MLGFIFCVLFLNLEVLGEKKHNWRIDTRKNYSPGYVCNYEPYFLTNLNFVLYTCVHESKCKKVGGYTRSLRHPELDFDNCNFTFHPPAEGGSYICCHPEDNEDTMKNPNATITTGLTKFMPGFRSAFKCKDYASAVCLNTKYCPDSRRREFKGGTATDIGKYPHLAVVGWHNKETNEQYWFCLGSIISEMYVLSAASCTGDKQGHIPAVVRVGEQNLCKVGIDCEPSKTAQRIPIVKRIHHPANLLAWYYHDIMIFKLARKIVFNSNVRPACLITSMNTYQSGGMFAMYEELAQDGKTENTTHEMEIQIYSTQICSRWYSFDVRLVDPGIDPKIMFCAGLGHVDKVPCIGDFGGPLQVQKEVPYCMWQIYGVFVYSQTFFCRGNKPPIFTRVPYYLDWIEEEIWHDFNLFTEFDTCSGQCKDALAYVAPPPDDGRCPA